MLTHLLVDYGTNEFSTGRAVFGTILLHVLWFRHSSLLPPLVRHAGRVALMAARLMTALLFLETIVSSLVLPAQIIVGPDLAPKLVDQGWDVFNVTAASPFGAEHFVNAAMHKPSEAATHPGLTVLFLPPNGAGYENFADFMIQYATAVGAEQVVGVNYRGVGQSTGSPISAQDLVDDVEAVIDFLVKERGIDDKLLLVHGWSLGGAVALQLRQHRPQLLVVSDRSFRSLSAAAVGMLEEPTIAGVVGLGAGFLLAVVLCGDSLKQFRFLAKWGGLVLCIAFAAGGLTILIPDLLHLFRWEFAISEPEVLYSAPLVVLFHREDGILNYDSASLHQSLDLSQQAIVPIELTYSFPDKPASNHMYQANMVPNEWNLLIKAIQENLPTV